MFEKLLQGGPPAYRVHRKKYTGLHVHSLSMDSYNKMCVTLYQKAETLQVYSFEYETSPQRLFKLCNVLPPERSMSIIPVPTELKEEDEDSQRWQNLILRRAPFLNKNSFKNIRVSCVSKPTNGEH